MTWRLSPVDFFKLCACFAGFIKRSFPMHFLTNKLSWFSKPVKIKTRIKNWKILEYVSFLHKSHFSFSTISYKLSIKYDHNSKQYPLHLNLWMSLQCYQDIYCIIYCFCGPVFWREWGLLTLLFMLIVNHLYIKKWYFSSYLTGVHSFKSSFFYFALFHFYLSDSVSYLYLSLCHLDH